MSIDLSQIEPLGIEPIPGDSPGGTNIQDSDDYDRAERAFMALTSIEGASSGDVKPLGVTEHSWEDLANVSIKILKEKSKNIRVTTFLILALFNEEGMPGLLAGLKLLDNLLKNFWETMYPPLKLIKGRTSAIEFVATRIAGESDSPGGALAIKGQAVLTRFREVKDSNPSRSAMEAGYEELKSNYEAIVEMKKTMEALREKIYALFPQDKLPVVTTLNDTIKDLELNIGEEVKKNKPAEAAPAGSEAPPAAVASSAPRPQAAPAAAAVSAGSPDEARKALIKLAPVIREADPSDPASYRLARMGIWGALKALPPTKEGNTTRVPPGAVNKNLIESTTALLTSGNWLMLLNQSESRFPNSPLWLDQQRHIYRALKGMGPAFDAAARAVSDELANFIKRLPGIQFLTFDGGIPFADGETQAWIDSEVLAGASNGAGGGGLSMPASSGSNGSSGLDDALKEARGLLNDGKLPEALRLLQSGPKGGGSLRDRFVWRMALARLAQESGKARLTQPIWESLLDEIERYNLEAWEPELCVPVFQALYRVCKADKDQASRADMIFGRLCRLDVGAALGLEK